MRFEVSLTIVAVGTSPASGQVGIVRISGHDTRRLLKGIAVIPPQRGVADTRLLLGEFDLPCTVLWMPGPRSYTGEDVAELLLPGNTLLLGLVVEQLIERGVANGLAVGEAAPGEFTYRAWRAGRLTIARAEAVMQLVHADSEAALAVAHRAGQGAWHGRIGELTEACSFLLATVEAGIDFTDEEDVVLAPAGEVGRRIDALRSELSDVLSACSGHAFADERPLVRLCGQPSAGKSTLFNALLGRRRAVTMDSPHTTRDDLIEPCDFPGVSSARLADTPGVDPGAVPAEEADLIVWCVPVPDPAPDGLCGLIVRTKADLAPWPTAGVAVSARTGQGLDTLRETIGASLAVASLSADASVLSARQHGVLERLDGLLAEASTRASADAPDRSLSAPDIVASILRETLDQLGAITGAVPPDDVLGLVFASFCVGK